jgi:predicted TIM-barrel fold metal-dependent hydrolase
METDMNRQQSEGLDGHRATVNTVPKENKGASMKKLAIVSTDSHAGPRVETYRDYLESRYHEDLDQLVEEEREYLDITSKIGVYSEAQLEVVDTEGAIGSGGVEGAWDLDRRLKEMDREGIAAEVFLQGHQSASTPFFGAINRYYPAELRMAGVRAYNRWQADMLDGAGGRLIGVIEQTPVADLDEVVREVRWAGERGFRGLAFSSVSDPAVPQPPLHDPYWEQLWKAAADYSLALVIHVGLGSPQGTTFELFRQRAQSIKGGDYDRNSAERSVNLMEADDPRMRELFALNYSPRQALWQLMVGGVFDRYPNLHFIPTEARADWVPETLAHMDARFEAGGTPLTRRPSEYWAEQCFAGASFIHRHEVENRHAIGVRTLTFGRDYPHPEGTWPNTKDWLRAAFAGVPEEEARLILGENAMRCYGVDRERVDATAEKIGPSVDEILGAGPVPAGLVTEFEKRGGFLKDAPPLVPDRLDTIIEEALAPTAGA